MVQLCGIGDKGHWHFPGDDIVEFRPLIGVGNVFEEQGMELELLPERFQDFHLWTPLHLPR